MDPDAAPAPPSPGPGRMSFAEHLDELRARILKALLALSAAVAAGFVFQRPLLDLATIPHVRAMTMIGQPTRLSFTTFTEPVRSTMLLAFTAGLLAASPVILYQAWAFVRTGLHRRERRLVARFALLSALLFALGCSAGYFLLIPWLLVGLAGLLPPDQVQPVILLGDYLRLVLALTVALGALFQVPLVMAFLARAGLAAAERLARYRRHAWVAGLVLAAVAAPGDPLSLLILATPLLLLYEAGLWAARLAAPSGPRR